MPLAKKPSNPSHHDAPMPLPYFTLKAGDPLTCLQALSTVGLILADRHLGAAFTHHLAVAFTPHGIAAFLANGFHFVE